MSKKLKKSLLLILSFIVICCGLTLYLDKTYLNQFEREAIIGEDRYETMVKVSQLEWKKSKEAVLVNSSSMLDSISASPFAYKKNIPMFFIEKNNLNTTIKDELERLGVEKVYLIGGELSIESSVENNLRQLNIETERISGDTGFETTLLLAQKVIDENSGNNKMALINRDYGIPNGVSFASVAQRNNIPIIVMNKNNEDDVLEFAKENNIDEVYILGSTEQISTSLEKSFKKATRINGSDRYDTNKKIISEFYNIDSLSNVYITKGGTNNQADFLNALSISPIAAKNNEPVFLSKDNMDKDLLSFLENLNVKKITEVGFKFERPKIINENSIRYFTSIVIIALGIFALKSII